MRAKLIINPVAGNWRRKRKLPLIKEKLGSAGFVLDEFVTSKRGDAGEEAARAAREGYDIVIPAGGDGTINECINALHGTQTCLGLVPLGTANTLLQELGIPQDADRACDVIIGGARRPIDLGIAGDRYFATMAGAGFDALTARRVRGKVKKHLGIAAYHLMAWLTWLNYKTFTMSVQLDGDRRTEGCLVIICNSGRYGGRYRIGPDASIVDGHLDVLVLEKNSKYSILEGAINLLKGKIEETDGIKFYKTREVTVCPPGSREVLVQADGDLAGVLPMDFRIKPGAVTVMAPPEDKI